MQTIVPSDVEVVRPIRRTIVLLALRIFLILFLVDSAFAALLLANVAGFVPLEWATSYAVFVWIVYTAKYLLLTYAIIKLVVDWTGTVYYVTGGHLVRQRGMLHIVETVFQLRDIESVVLDQSWLGHLLNFGNVNITFDVAREKERVNLYAVNAPQRYEDLFSKFI